MCLGCEPTKLIKRFFSSGYKNLSLIHLVINIFYRLKKHIRGKARMAEGEEGREAEVTSYLALVAQIIPRQNCDYLPFKNPCYLRCTTFMKNYYF